MPHTWLSPAARKWTASTASLRHVRGFPALGLLRRLRPSNETSPGLSACQVLRPGARRKVLSFLEGTRGVLGGRLYPWQLRSSSHQDSMHDAPACTGAPDLRNIEIRISLPAPHVCGSISVQRLPTPTSTCVTFRHACFTMTPVVARQPRALEAVATSSSRRSAFAARSFQPLSEVHGALTGPGLIRARDGSSAHRSPPKLRNALAR